MNIGNYYRDILQSPLTAEHTLQQRAAAFAHALDNPEIAMHAVGARTPLLPNQVGRLEQIRADLAREARAAAHAGNAKDHANNLHTAASDWVGGHAPHGTPGLPRATLNAMMGVWDRRIADRVSHGLQTPAGTATLVRNALAKQAAVAATGRAINRTGRALTRYPAVYNMLSPDQQE